MEIVVPEARVRIKIGPNSYEIQEPRMSDITEFQKLLSEAGEDVDKQSQVFPVFLKKLGLPEAVVDGLGVYQTKIISDGLMEPLKEKK